MKKFLSKNLLITGVTGSGKSSLIHDILLELLNVNNLIDLRLILIDPKKVEFYAYSDLPSLLTPVIFENENARQAFSWAFGEALRRLRKVGEQNCNSVQEYNKIKYIKEKIPAIYIIVDEFSDLMHHDKKFFETHFERMTAISGLVEMYLIVSTSRPDPKSVLTKSILNCFKTRIAFKLADESQSELVLGEKGAEQLPEKGVLLMRELADLKTRRIEIEAFDQKQFQDNLNKIKDKYKVFYEGSEDDSESDGRDIAYPKAKEILISTGYCSVSLFQRKLRISYFRAMKLMELFEEDGLIGPEVEGEPSKYIGPQ